MQNVAVAKDKTFNLRLDESDRKRLDSLAVHYSAPAATVVRILIKEKHEQLKRERSAERALGRAMQSHMKWQAAAQEAARRAHEEDFSTHFGTGEVTDGGKPIGFLAFDNHPYRFREDDHAALRRWLEARGFKLAAEASYPPPGKEDAGYTTAWIVLCPDILPDDIGSAESDFADEWAAIWKARVAAADSAPPRLTPIPGGKSTEKKK